MSKEILILFDESGTPSFDKDTNLFIGVSLLYFKVDEQRIIISCDETFGLSKTKPLKNNKIGKKRVIKMAECLGKLPVLIVLMTIDMLNSKLRDIVNNHKTLSDEIRKVFRNDIRDQSVSQIVYRQVLEECLFKIIVQHLKPYPNLNFDYYPFVDNWSFPKADEHILLNYHTESLENRIITGCRELGYSNQHIVHPIELLNVDSKRKRLIDGCATIVSRAYFTESHPKFSTMPLEVLEKELVDRIIIEDITNDSIKFLNRFSKNLKVNKETGVVND